MAVTEFNRHDQLSGGSECRMVCPQSSMEMTVRWQDENWTPLQLLSFIPIVTQRNRVEAGHEVKTSGPVENNDGIGNVHMGR